MIVWHLARYQETKVSRDGCCDVVVRNELNRLPDNISKRSRAKFTRYEKKVPDHHVQIDVKVLKLKDKDGNTIKPFQYTAIDECLNLRATYCVP